MGAGHCPRGGCTDRNVCNIHGELHLASSSQWALNCRYTTGYSRLRWWYAVEWAISPESVLTIWNLCETIQSFVHVLIIPSVWVVREILLACISNGYFPFTAWLYRNPSDRQAVFWVISNKTSLFFMTIQSILVAIYFLWEAIYPCNIKGGIIRRFRNKCYIVEEPNSSSKHGVRVKVFSLIKRNFLFWWEYEPIRKLSWCSSFLIW